MQSQHQSAVDRRPVPGLVQQQLCSTTVPLLLRRCHPQDSYEGIWLDRDHDWLWKFLEQVSCGRRRQETSMHLSEGKERVTKRCLSEPSGPHVNSQVLPMLWQRSLHRLFASIWIEHICGAWQPNPIAHRLDLFQGGTLPALAEMAAARDGCGGFTASLLFTGCWTWWKHKKKM